MESLIKGESGFDPYIVNQHSLACGLFQALPCSKAGGKIYWDTGLNKYRLDPKSFDIKQHIQFGINYIKERYKTPVNAYLTWLSRSPNWY